MKKVLFATTALVASAGIASAQGVDITGSAEMGFAGGTGVAEAFFQSVDVRFTMTGETDNGLSFGATVDLADVDDDDGGNDSLADTTGAFADFSVFIAGDFGTLTMGDVDGAMDWALTEAVGNPGSIDDAETAHEGYVGGNYLDGSYQGQILRYDYALGDFGFAVSAELDETGTNDAGFGVGFTYDVDLGGAAIGFGLAYQTASGGDTIGNQTINPGIDIDVIALSADIDVNGFVAGITYADISATGNDMEHYQISAGYSFDAFSVGANYGEFNGASSDSGFGLAASYDLGVGASVLAGYSSSDNSGVERWSLGVSMEF